jgi:hypothetical protein
MMTAPPDMMTGTDQIWNGVNCPIVAALLHLRTRGYWWGAYLDIAEFLREKAAQCRALADEVSNNDMASRSMLALALELDAQAVAVEAGRLTAREIEMVPPGGEKPQPD